MHSATALVPLRLLVLPVFIPFAIAALPLTGGAEQPRPAGRVLADGDPPLTQGMVDQFGSFMEWTLDVKLTQEQRRTLRAAMVERWEQNDAAAMRGIHNMVGQYRQVAAADEATRDYWRQENQPKYLRELRRGKDATSRWALEVYESAHEPIAEGDPPLTRQMADAQLEVLCFVAAVVRGTQPAELNRDVKDAWADFLAGRWPQMTDAQRKDVAGMPLLWSAIRAGWPKMPEKDKAKYRAQWQKDFGPLLERKPGAAAPEVPPAEAGGVQEAVDKALAASEQKNRELDEKINSGDPNASAAAAMQKLQHQQATYQMISNISRMRHEASMAIIHNMGSGWQYEYR